MKSDRKSHNILNRMRGNCAFKQESMVSSFFVS
nr:MAG TPA: hypothetical protein [Caudoviricetes sp.]